MRASAREFAEFNGLLGSVVEKGLPLPPALRLMAGIVRGGCLREGLNDVARDLDEGMSLPDALAKHPESFAPEYCGLVRAGVDSGRLPEVLRTAQVHHSLRARLGVRLGRLLLYVLSGAAIGELVVLVALMLGRYTIEFNNQMMQQTQMQMTQKPGIMAFVEFVMGSGSSVLLLWPGLIGVCWFGYWITQRYARFSWIGYSLPVWGRIQKSRDLALFCCALGLRLRAGASTVDALRSGRDAVVNRRFRALADELIRRTGEGESLSSALFYTSFFPRTLAWGLSLGEENGEVPRTIDTFAELYTAEMERNFELLTELLTPLGILAVGNIALLSALLILAPFFTMMTLSQNFYG